MALNLKPRPPASETNWPVERNAFVPRAGDLRFDLITILNYKGTAAETQNSSIETNWLQPTTCAEAYVGFCKGRGLGSKAKSCLLRLTNGNLRAKSPTAGQFL